MMMLPPTSFTAEQLQAFKKDFFDSGETTIYGDCNMDQYESAEAFLQRRPWLPNSFLFLSVEDSDPIGCIRITPRFSAASVASRAFNIGYSVRPSMRNKGYGKKQLEWAVQFLRSFGVAPFLITADTDNIASRKVIESCGGHIYHSLATELIYQIP